MRHPILSLLLAACALPAACGADLRFFDDAALRAVHFVDAEEGWVVGDEGVKRVGGATARCALGAPRRCGDPGRLVQRMRAGGDPCRGGTARRGSGTMGSFIRFSSREMGGRSTSPPRGRIPGLGVLRGEKLPGAPGTCALRIIPGNGVLFRAHLSGLLCPFGAAW